MSIRHALYAITALLPIYLLRFSIGPLPTTVLEVLIVITLIAWAVDTHKQQRLSISWQVIKQWKWISIGTGLMLLGALLGFILSPDPLSSLGALKSFFIEPILIALAMIEVETRKKRALHKIITPYLVALSIPALVASVFAIIQWATGAWIPVAWLAERRATGVFPYPNALGHFLAPIITALTLVLITTYKHLTTRTRALFFSTLIISLIAIALSETEAAWVAIAATLFLAFLVIGKRTRHLAIAGAVAVAILLVGSTSIRSLAMEKLLLKDWSGQTRIAQWEETWNYLTDTPEHFLLGAGLNTYPLSIEPYHTHDYLEIFQQPHTLVLTVWTELGLVGLIGFLIFAGGVGYIIIRQRSQLFVVPLGAALIETTIHGLVDVPYFKNDLSVMTWLLLALLFVAAHHKKLTTSQKQG